MRRDLTPSLSVVVVAVPGSATSDVARSFRRATADLGAQVILVSQDSEPDQSARIPQSWQVVPAPKGSTRAEMCDLGMRLASGSIVAVRDAASVGDGSWLDAYRGVLPFATTASHSADESMVMDTMDVTRRFSADAPLPPDVHPRVAAIEVAAAI